MKAIKTLLFAVAFGVLFSSCEEIYYEEVYFDEPIALPYNPIEDYDLWYVDYHQTQGANPIPFMSRAFTLSFVNGVMYANNNISGIGIQGNGFGIDIGTYFSTSISIRTTHDIDGLYNFEVFQLSANEIRLTNQYTNTSYVLVGYDVHEFDYDRLFYENIEYLLQDYEVWNKTNTSTNGTVNEFDNENYLKFTPENNTTFYSSRMAQNLPLENVIWDFVGGYEVFDVEGYEDLKILDLIYEGGAVESFEVSILKDNLLEFYHYTSGTTYRFEGNHFIQYLKGKKKSQSTRKRSVVKRKTRKKFKS